MSQGKTMADANNDKMIALRNAAWTALATNSLDQIELDLVADMAGVDRGLTAALAGSVQRLVLAKMKQLDRQALIETYDNIQDAGAVSIREKIIEGLLQRFETYAPYRSQIDQLNRSVLAHPELALRLLDDLEFVIRCILVMSGDPASGLKGMIRVKGVAGVFLTTARVWMKDDSNDLATTMKMLDQRMSQAEEWGISLRLFRSEPSHNDANNQASDDHENSFPVASHHGVDNE